MKLKLSHKVVLVISIPVLFQAFFFFFFLDSIKELDAMEKEQEKTARLLLLRDQLNVAMDTGGWYFTMFRISHKPEYKEKLDANIRKIDKIFEQFLFEWKDNPVRSHLVRSSWNANKLNRKFALMVLLQGTGTTISDLIGGPLAISQFRTRILSNRSENLVLSFGELNNDQMRLKKAFEDKESELNKMLYLAMLSALLLSVLIMLLFSASIVRRLHSVAANIRSMENHEPHLSVIRGSDEIAVLNQAILETDEKIRQAEEFQAQTARIVAQELKDPIDHLSRSFTELQEEGFETLTADGKQRLERSIQEINRLRLLTRDLLSLDKISRAGWDLNIEKVNLAEIANIAIDTVKDFAASVSVTIVGDLGESLAAGDASRLQQITLNLLTNAIKFSKRNRSIEVETKVESNYAKLSVTDHGMGIPDEFQQSIFGKFEQASREDSTEKGGSGLGLAISKKLIEAQHGKMGFHSKLGEGSTFWFMLPLHKDGGVAVKASAKFDGLVNQKSSRKDDFKIHPTLWLSGLSLALLPMVLQLATYTLLWFVVHQIGTNASAYYRSSQIAAYHARLMGAIAGSSQLVCVYNVEKDEQFKFLAQTKQRIISDLLYELKNDCRGDKKLEENVEFLERLCNRAVKIENEIMDAPQNMDTVGWFGSGKVFEMLNLLDQASLPVKNAIDAQNEVIDSNVLAKVETRKSIELVVLVSSVLTLILAVLLGAFLMRRLAARVNHVVANTQNLIDKKDLAPPLEGTDEIAFVDRAFFDAGNHLIQLERFKQEIIAITSHEFRTPLTSLLAKIDLMLVGVFGNLNDKGKNIAQSARNNISYLIVLITNLLDVEKIQSGRIIVSKDSASIDSIFEKISANVEEVSSQRGVSIRCDAVEVSAKVDATRLVQSISAVLRDIIDHSPTDSTIRLSAKLSQNRLIMEIAAPGGETAQKALDTASARGRLAVDLINLIAEQHGGATEIAPGEGQLLVTVTVPLAD